MSNTAQSSVDHYLSRIARKAWPNASVTVHPEPDGSKSYRLNVPGETPFDLGKIFGPARMTLRAIVFQHLPPEANRAEFTFDMRVIDDAKKPGEEERAFAAQLGATLSEKSNSRTDAILAGKLLALGTAGGAFTLSDVYALRKHGEATGEKREEYEQLAKAIARWCDLED